MIIGTGAALAKAGPASILISYSIVGFIVYMVMCALGEMATWLPLESGFTGVSAVHLLGGFHIEPIADTTYSMPQDSAILLSASAWATPTGSNVHILAKAQSEIVLTYEQTSLPRQISLLQPHW